MHLFNTAGYKKNRQDISPDVDIQSAKNTRMIKNTRVFTKFSKTARLTKPAITSKTHGNLKLKNREKTTASIYI